MEDGTSSSDPGSWAGYNEGGRSPKYVLLIEVLLGRKKKKGNEKKKKSIKMYVKKIIYCDEYKAEP